MKSILFRTASFFFVLSIVLTSNAFAQQRVSLFETFSGTADPCNLGTETSFESAVNSTVSQEGSKVIHLNYFLGIQPPYNLDESGAGVDALLSGGNGSVIYTGAVDREVFSNTGVRIDPTNTGSYSDWGAQVDADAGTAEATVTLNDATLDKTNSQSYVLHANMTVTANTTISDSLIIRYAITEDDLSFDETCGSSSAKVNVNDFVLYVSSENTGNYVVCTSQAGLSAGDTVHVTLNYSIDVSDPLYENAANMKLVAFLEDEGPAGSGNYFVANAAILKKDLDTLQAPAPTLSFNENYISDSTLAPGSVAQIFYTSTNLPSGVRVYYSLDNGTTWRYIENSSFSPANWTVPDSVTTHGKIKLVAVGDTTLSSTEVGTFAIAIPPSVTFITPPPDTEISIKADSMYTISWSKVSVDSVLLRYSSNNGLTFTALQNNADTFYVWNVPDTTLGIIIQLVPDNKSVPATSVIDTIKETEITNKGSVANGITPTGLTITNIFPNPASNGEEIEVQYLDAQPKPIAVQLLDLLGRVMPENYTTDNLAIHLNTSSLSASAYVVRLSDGTNVVSKRVEVIR